MAIAPGLRRYRARVVCMDCGGRTLSSVVDWVPEGCAGALARLERRAQWAAVPPMLGDHAGCEHVEAVTEPVEDW